jgi:hypothetical protein
VDQWERAFEELGLEFQDFGELDFALLEFEATACRSILVHQRYSLCR